MKLIDPRTAHVLRNPVAFVLQVSRAFQANQGLLLAGAVAYYAMLSIVPLLILMVIALSHVIDQDVLLATLRRALEYVVPGEGRAVVVELRAFLDHREVIGWVFGYIAFIGAALFASTFVIADLMTIGGENLVLLGHSWSLSALSRFAIYVAGVAGVIVLISAIYYFMPVGRLSARHALIGGATAGLLWELIRHALGWYFGTLSHVSLVYGSLTTAIIVLLSLEVAATLLLLGAQVIAEYESIETGEAKVSYGGPPPSSRAKPAS